MKVILSIDIGIRTLSMYKEKFDYQTACGLTCGTNRYNKDGTATEEFMSYYKKLFKLGSCLFINKKDISHNDNAKFISKEVIFNLYDHLDKLYKDGVFDDVTDIIIEKQLHTNPNAQIIEHHIYGYFLLIYRNFKNTVLFQSKNKTRVLGAPLKCIDQKTKRLRKVRKNERKKWSTDIAKEIIESRNDSITLDYIYNKNKQKKDDLADTIVQCLAYNILSMI